MRFSFIISETLNAMVINTFDNDSDDIKPISPLTSINVCDLFLTLGSGIEFSNFQADYQFPLVWNL